ncbi:zinc-binding dehydrogenase [Halarcobacter sp.]|uniref:zinc-binding dehydrogenase n=1 Tax=Halarcobacter sp. TaxID=2321133 RepID=UPI002AA8B5B2|nr:zinc-binding dehydrogenase [Halarcobacter sp.]
MKNSTMKAMVLMAHGGIENLVYKDVNIPKLKNGEVLIKITATAKNNTDRKAREGLYPVDDNNKNEITSFNMSGDNTFQFPRIQGADIVGTVVKTAQDVDKNLIEKRGLVDFNIYLSDNLDLNLTPDYYGHGADGGFAEYVAIPGDNFYPIENKDLDDAQLASLGMCSYQTGFRMLNASRVKAGDKVLISGASGGVGTALIQMCRVLGAIPYAISSKDKEKELLSLGAQKVIDRADSSILYKNILEATNGENIDAVMDLVGGEFTNIFIDTMLVDMKKRDDYPRLSIAGASSYNITEILWSKIYLYQVEIHGVSHGTKNEANQLMQWIKEGKLKPILHATFKLSQLHEAEKYFVSRGKGYLGKIVIVPDSQWEEHGKKYSLKVKS